MALIIAVGRLGRNPEVHYSQSGKQFFTFSLADIDSSRNKEDPNKTDTDWWDCILFTRDDKEGTNVQTHMAAGALVYVEGSPKSKEPYTGRDGVKKTSIQINIRKWKVLQHAEKKDGEKKAAEPQNKLPYSDKPPDSGEFSGLDAAADAAAAAKDFNESLRDAASQVAPPDDEVLPF